ASLFFRRDEFNFECFHRLKTKFWFQVLGMPIQRRICCCVRRKGSRAKGESPMDSPPSSTTRILHRYGTARRTLFKFFRHHWTGLKSSALSVPILAQPHDRIEASA